MKPIQLCRYHLVIFCLNRLANVALKPLYDKLFRVVFRYRLVKLHKPYKIPAHVERISTVRLIHRPCQAPPRRHQAACTSEVKLAAASMSTATIRDTPCSCMVTPIS